MHLSASTLTSLLAAAALTLSRTTLAATTAECLRTRARELADGTACGDKGALNHCISQIRAPDAGPSIELALQSELERCLANTGCTAQEAQIEAFWTLRRCDEDANAGSELRRRLQQRDAAAANANAMAAMPVARNPGPAAFAAGSTPVADSADDALRRRDTTSTGVPPACYSTDMVSTTACATQSTGDAKGSTLTCYPTTVASESCIEGLLCMEQNGNNVCMYKQTSLGTAGWAVLLYFAVAVFLSICGMCFFCIRDSRYQKKVKRMAEAEAIAREAKQASMGSSSGPSKPRLGAYQTVATQEADVSEESVNAQHNPFAEQQHASR